MTSEGGLGRKQCVCVHGVTILVGSKIRRLWKDHGKDDAL